MRIRMDKPLSGNSYVVMSLKEAGPDPAEGYAVRIRSEKLCLHVSTVCTKCMEQWMDDWNVHFDRTGGGRNMKKALDESEAS